MIDERTVTVDQSDPNRSRFDPSRVGKPNPADTEPRPATSPEVAEATHAELRRWMTRAGEQPPSRVHTAPDLAARAAARAAGQIRRRTMPDGSHDAHTPMSAEALDDAERRALIAAVAEARADPRPAVPHEEVRAEMLRDLEELRRRMEALPSA